MVAELPVEPQLLAQLLEIPVARVTELCRAMAEEYEAEGRGFALVSVAGGWRFQSHADLAPYVERFVLEGQSARLSAAALETLAIVAYKQPVSRAQVAAIRGVNVDGVMRTLHAPRLHRRGRQGPGPGPGDPVRHHVAVPRAARPQRPRPAPAAERVRAGRRRRGAPRGGAAPPAGSHPQRAARRARGAPPPAARASRSRSASTRSISATSTTRRGVAAVPEEGDGVRLQKVLAQAGLGSRRDLRGPDRAAARPRERRGGRARPAGRSRGRRGRGRRRPDRREAGARPLPAPQAGRGHHDRLGPAGPSDGRRPRAGRAAGVPGRSARRRLRGPAAAHQRRRPHPPPHPPELRRGQGVPRRGGGRPVAGRAGEAARRASSSTTAAPRRPRSPSSTRACSASRSTRAATARCAACARRSAIRCSASSARASARSPTGR